MLFLLSLDLLFSLIMSLVALALKLFLVVCGIVGVVTIVRALTGRTD